MSLSPNLFDPSYSPQRRQRSPALRILFFILGFYILSCLIWGEIFFYNTIKNSSSGIPAETYSPNEYQAVFLDNNQVYFGRITHVTSDILTLTNIYYLNTATTQSSSTSGISLIKLGSEIHAPEDQMFIPLSHVLYYENLQASSKVVQAIEAHQN